MGFDGPQMRKLLLSRAIVAMLKNRPRVACYSGWAGGLPSILSMQDLLRLKPIEIRKIMLYNIVATKFIMLAWQ